MAPTLTTFRENLAVLHKDGDLVYKGEWHDGKRNGLGTSYSTESGSYQEILYTGEWKDDKYHGLGTLYDSKNPTEVLYKGEFKKNEYHGMGCLFEDGELKYKGDFKNGTYHGTGVLHEHDFGDQRYEGDFCMGERQGFGVQYVTDPDHDIENKVYEGSWDKDLFSGYGTAFFDVDPDNQVQFDGMWKKGQFVQGKEWALDPDMDDYTIQNVPYLLYDGAFAKGKRHGKGTEYAKDGTVVFFGEWVHGQRGQEGDPEEDPEEESDISDDEMIDWKGRAVVVGGRNPVNEERSSKRVRVE
jgi:hypothetical protein